MDLCQSSGKGYGSGHEYDSANRAANRYTSGASGKANRQSFVHWFVVKESKRSVAQVNLCN
jgi:hypothetical protein